MLWSQNARARGGLNPRGHLLPPQVIRAPQTPRAGPSLPAAAAFGMAALRSPGHPRTVTCPQPVHGEDSQKETTADLWFRRVVQMWKHEGGSGGICSGSGSAARPLWDSLLYYVKTGL